jgi:septal ring factor EnvC (AmiA/AmiB activator)
MAFDGGTGGPPPPGFMAYIGGIIVALAALVTAFRSDRSGTRSAEREVDERAETVEPPPDAAPESNALSERMFANLLDEVAHLRSEVAACRSREAETNATIANLRRDVKDVKAQAREARSEARQARAAQAEANAELEVLRRLVSARGSRD